jgi:hypothetical protein
VSIATIAARIRLTFENITVGLLVGIGGGVPRLPTHDVRLADVVVGAPEYGPAVVQYDLGKQLSDGSVQVTRTLDKPPARLLAVVNKIQDEYMRAETGEGFFADHLKRFEKKPRLREKYGRPTVPDRLFRADYEHKAGTACADHDAQYEVRRPHRDPQTRYKSTTARFFRVT